MLLQVVPVHAPASPLEDPELLPELELPLSAPELPPLDPELLLLAPELLLPAPELLAVPELLAPELPPDPEPLPVPELAPELEPPWAPESLLDEPLLEHPAT